MNAHQYPYLYRIEVAFRDLDVLGHVNNAVYLSYLESARIAYLMKLLEMDDIARLPLILAEVTIAYKSPAVFGEVLLVGTGISRLGNKSFDASHRIDTTDGRFIASARTVLVVYDYEAQTTVPIPDALRQRIAAYQGEWRLPDL